MASSTCLMLPDRTTQYFRTGSHLCLRLETLSFSSWSGHSWSQGGYGERNGCPPPYSAVPRPAVPHLPGAHVAAEGVSVAAASRVQLTLVNGYADTAVPAPAFVACAVVGAQGPRDTLGLREPRINESGLQGRGQRAGVPPPAPEAGLREWTRRLTFSEQPPRSGREQGLLGAQEKPSPSKPSRQRHLGRRGGASSEPLGEARG